MKNRVSGLAVITLAALLCFALPALGQVTVQFEAGLSSYGDAYGSDQTGLYGGVINGVNTQMVCDDFYHNISDGQSWSANVVNVASLSSTAGLQFASIGLNGYTELAYLVSQMFALGNTDPADKSLISQAIWYITSGGSAGTSNVWSTNAANFLATFGTAGLTKFAWLEILTPTNQSSSGPQEMWAPVPEGGTALLYLLLAGVACFGAMFFRSRNQVSRPGMA